jgi:hypothetical protein
VGARHTSESGTSFIQSNWAVGARQSAASPLLAAGSRSVPARHTRVTAHHNPHDRRAPSQHNACSVYDLVLIDLGPTCKVKLSLYLTNEALCHGDIREGGGIALMQLTFPKQFNIISKVDVL